MRKITEYFRSAVIASSQGVIDFKKNKFAVVSEVELNDGVLNLEKIDFIKNQLVDLGIDTSEIGKEKTKDILIALKTVKTKYSDMDKIEELEEMTALMFLPAKVNNKGKLLLPDEGKVPWIPREYLQPMVEPQIAIGDIKDYDTFLESTVFERAKIETWNEYLQHAKKMYEVVTKVKFEEQCINYDNKEIELDGNYYVFIDETVYATFHIRQLYNHLLVNDENKLYSRITNGQIEQSLPLFENNNITKMKEHMGQMGGEYPLSPSQRETINHYTELKEGEVLAVNGPPGTGKTTLLQSIVADLYVKHAIEEKEAPIIVAASTNNQAVTNIIDSFGKVNPVGIKNLEKRWITGIHSFATYFPSRGKVKEAIDNNYQYTSVYGNGFLEEIETQDNRDKSKKLFLSEFKKYFNTTLEDFSECKDIISNKLRHLNSLKNECFEQIEKIKSIIGVVNCSEFVDNLDKKLVALECEEYNKEKEIEANRERTKQALERCHDWRQAYNSLPWYVRFLKFVPCFKNQILTWSYNYMQDNELEFLKRGMSIEEVESKYYKKINEMDELYAKLQQQREIIRNNKIVISEQKKEIKNEFDRLVRWISILKKENILFSHLDEKQLLWDSFNIGEFNNCFDGIRYVEFWLAVHYYECKWLLEENPITEKQKKKTFENVLNKRYHRLAMLSPCMVMTFFMLPKQFYAYENNDKTHFYMYNFIDLLIVDEAGQISPEIAAPSFSLAKKAVVVGDEQQIAPVWSTTRALDIAMAIGKSVIKNEDEFKMLEKNGLNCSGSSIMKVASLSCTYDKYGKGLFLSEHRRCYDEIIEYCNKLVYKGNLEPLRGLSSEDEKYALARFLPTMGHKQILVEKSQRVGGSRQNEYEARVIVEWLKQNYDQICLRYSNFERGDLNDEYKRGLVGIITPFKSQSCLIKRILRQESPNLAKYVSVGTVHTFQGAERKIIIFSSVYGNADGCFFIDRNDNLMNVAVSRAKDSFLVFGDRGCLATSANSASGLLRSMTMNEI